MLHKRHGLKIASLIFAALLAACGPAATPTPTAVPPTAEPTVAPTSEPTMEATAEATAEAAAEGDAQRLILATTTSTEDSGLLDYLLPFFEEAYNADVDVVAVGTGQALEIGSKGDADVVLVHARAREDAFVEAGDAVARFDVMFNDFILIGPEEDPANVKEAGSAVEAFQRIASAEASFISRGDDSGTHTKELSIWAAAEVEPAGDWYVSAGQGMGAVIGMSDEVQGYTLSDRATYLARKEQGLSLVILYEGDAILLNPYGVMAVNPEKHLNVNAELAQTFIDWLISVETQERILGFEIGGGPVFFPDSEPYRAAQGS